jgi:hypothetical protein
MAGVGTAVTSGDIIPLLDDNGSGQYIKGRNNARDIRTGLLSALFQANASGVFPRDGVLMGVGGTGALKVNAQGSPNQTVLIGRGAAIVSRTGQGPYLFYNEVDQTVNMPAASGANTRYDIVCAAVFDKGAFVGDALHGPHFWVESGALGGGVPATPAGMIKLAEVFRAVNDNTISAEIADKRMSTVVSGAPRSLGPGDLLTDPGILIGEMRDTGTSVDRWDGTNWVPLGDFSGRRYVGTVTRVANLNYVTAGTVGDSVTFTPKPNYRYKLSLSGDYSGTASTAAQLTFRSVAGAGPITTGSTSRGGRVMPVPNGLTQGGFFDVELAAGLLGTSQVTVGYTVSGLAGNAGGTVNIGAQFRVEALGL